MVPSSASVTPSKPRNRAPRTIAVVGIDGSGKTTQAHLLAAALTERGLRARYRRNAGGRHWFGKLAEALGRRDGEDLLGRRGMLVVESALRWLALLRSVLLSRLTGEVTVMDRHVVCQYASLRTHAHSAGAERRARWAYRLFPAPDVTFLLAVEPEVAYERIERRGYDHEELSYLRDATAAYRSLPESGTFVVIDGNGSEAQVRADLLARLPVTAAPKPARVREKLVALATLLAAAVAVTWQLAETF
jgi:dTMP kinase